LRVLVILADADHHGPAGEITLEMPGGRKTKQYRVDIGVLQAAQDSARVGQCGDVYHARLVHGDDQRLAPGREQAIQLE
jgi:hypothetical protein